MILSDFSVKHPAIIAILMICLVVFGIIATGSLNTEMLPPVGLPMAVIVTIYPGASASEIERDISKIIENEMSTLPELKNISSSSSDSYSTVQLEFGDKSNVQEKLPQIREQLNGVIAKLPSGIQGAPQILLYESSSLLPILSVKLYSDMESKAFTDYVDTRISPALARIDGISKINIIGGTKIEARITLDVTALESRGLSALTVYQTLQYNNLNIPAGDAFFKSKNISFTSDGSFSSIDDIKNLTIGFSDNTYIYLKDVAEVELITEPKTVYVRSQNKDCIIITVLKRQDGDIIKIVNEVSKTLDEINKETNGIINYHYITNQSEMTTSSLNTVINSAATGLILTIIVILLTLHNLRATLIIGLSIPLSIMFALLGLYATGHSLNLLSLSGMTVAIGMIVDNSIVVLENTFKKFKISGNRKLSAMEGCAEVGGSVLASTTTSICVFAPLLFLTGILGIIMNDLSIAIVFALAASALVSVIIVPWLSSLILKNENEIKQARLIKKIVNALDSVLDKAESLYRKILTSALRNKAFVIVLSVALSISSFLLLSILKISFLPPTDTGEFEISIETPSGYSLEKTRNKVDQIALVVRELVPEIDDDIYLAGSSSFFVLSTTSNRGYGSIKIVDSKKRSRTIHEIIDVLQNEIPKRVSDCNVTVLNGGFDSLLALGTGGQGFQMEIYGTDLDSVTATAEKVRELIENDPDVFKAELSVKLNQEQLFANLSQEYMGSLGITPYEAGITSRILFSGMDAGKLRVGEDNYNIRIISDIADEAVNDDLLNRISLVSQDGRTIRFAAFSSLETETTLSSIERKNRNFSVNVTGYLVNEDQSGVSSRIMSKLEKMSMPYGVKYRAAGTSELIGDSISSLVFVIAIAVFLVYCVMVIQFEQFRQPLIIMVSIPFCLIGVVLGLYLFNSSLSIIALLAVITLGGTVVNNAIVMVDYTNQIRKIEDADGKLPELRSAVIEGAANRLRPILMTAMTTIFGVLPMALARGNGSEIYAPLGQAIFGGLFTSTLITLIIIPILYESLESKKAKKEKELINE